MIALPKTGIFEWDDVGYQTRLALEPNHRGYTLTRGSVHLLIECSANKLQVRLVVYGEQSKRTVDELLPFTPNELRTALNLPRNTSVTDEELARTMGAEFATMNFARYRNRLKIPHQDRWFYFFPYPWAQILLARYIDYNFPR